jgi:hypothetical protein
MEKGFLTGFHSITEPELRHFVMAVRALRPIAATI